MDDMGSPTPPPTLPLQGELLPQLQLFRFEKLSNLGGVVEDDPIVVVSMFFSIIPI